MPSTTPAQVPPLLRLPAELRNEIYSHLIQARTPPPPNPSFPGERMWQGQVAYPKHYCSWRYPTLVWVNRQLRNEYFALVEEYSSRRQIRAELDIMSKGYVFYPTWVLLPPDLPGEIPFDLHVNLRIFGTESYRSNDSWPRQPGCGFRYLLRMLTQLVHHGPSMGQHLELLRGRWLFTINTLSVNITFHDYYTPATWPETSHNIFRMLKALATHGVTDDIIRTVKAHAEYECQGKKMVYDSAWDVAAAVDAAKAEEWRSMGFLTPCQTSLKSDYRCKLEEDFV